MTNLISEKPVMMVSAASVVTHYRITAPQFLDHAIRQSLVDKFRCDVSNNLGTPDRQRRILPATKPEQLAIEFVGEPLCPWQQFLGDVGSKDAVKFVAIPYLLIPSGLVNQGRNSYVSQGAHQDIGLFGNLLLLKLEDPCITCAEPCLTYLWK